MFCLFILLCTPYDVVPRQGRKRYYPVLVILPNSPTLHLGLSLLTYQHYREVVLRSYTRYRGNDVRIRSLRWGHEAGSAFTTGRNIEREHEHKSESMDERLRA